MARLEIIRGSRTYDVTDGPIYWMGDDGTGMPPVSRVTQRGPQQHGDTDGDFRLDPRFIQLLVEVLPPSLEEHWNERDAILRLLRPSRIATSLRWTLDNGAVRQIDGHFSGGLTFSSDGREGFGQRDVVTLRCADPTFYDPERKFVSFTLESGGAGLTFPTPVSSGELVYTFGANSATAFNITLPLAYDGSWREYPEITIQGPITSPVITNVSTGDKLDFTGVTITSGTTYTIDLRYGYKTVKDQTGAYKESGLTSDSDLATFCLEADPDVPDGINSVRVTGSTVSAATTIQIRYYHRYVGF